MFYTLIEHSMTFLRTIWVLDGNNISIGMAYLLLTYFHFCSFPMIIIAIFSFKEISSRIYAIEIKAENDSIYCVSVFVLENVIGDVAGNKNLHSNDLQLCPCKDSYSCLLFLAQL